MDQARHGFRCDILQVAVMAVLQKLWRFVLNLDPRMLELFIAWHLWIRGLPWVAGWADMSLPGYRALTNVMDAPSWGLVFCTIGCIQLAVIVINGTWRRSPYLRMICLAFAAVMNTVLVWGFALNDAPLQSVLQNSHVVVASLIAFYVTLKGPRYG
jgi:hypothetical protein